MTLTQLNTIVKGLNETFSVTHCFEVILWCGDAGYEKSPSRIKIEGSRARCIQVLRLIAHLYTDADFRSIY